MASSMISIVLFCCIVLLHVLRRRKARLPLPPGPPAHPILGHIPVFPAKENRDDIFYQWAQQYGESLARPLSHHTQPQPGDVVHVNLLGKSIILLNSEQAAADLLDKRSANYSDRPAFPIYERCASRLCASSVSALILARRQGRVARRARVHAVWSAFHENAQDTAAAIQSRRSWQVLTGA